MTQWRKDRASKNQIARKCIFWYIKKTKIVSVQDIYNYRTAYFRKFGSEQLPK